MKRRNWVLFGVLAVASLVFAMARTMGNVGSKTPLGQAASLSKEQESLASKTPNTAAKGDLAKIPNSQAKDSLAKVPSTQAKDSLGSAGY